MFDFPTYVAMAPEEFLIHRSNGVVSMGAVVDAIRQPGVVGMYGRKPVFLYLNDAEQQLMMKGDIEAIFVLRGYKSSIVTNEPLNLPNTSIPGDPNEQV